VGKPTKKMATVGKMTHGDDKRGNLQSESGPMANNACKCMEKLGNTAFSGPG